MSSQQVSLICLHELAHFVHNYVLLQLGVTPKLLVELRILKDPLLVCELKDVANKLLTLVLWGLLQTMS